MTKRDLVVRISDETGMVQQQVQDIVQRTLDIIAESLAKGAKVELRNFGVFDVKVRKARIGRNPNAPTNDVRIPPRAIVKFKPGKEMRDGRFRHRKFADRVSQKTRSHARHRLEESHPLPHGRIPRH